MDGLRLRKKVECGRREPSNDFVRAVDILVHVVAVFFKATTQNSQNHFFCFRNVDRDGKFLMSSYLFVYFL